MKTRLSGVLMLALVCPAAWATGITDISIEGDRVIASIGLDGGIAAQLTITFEQVVGLTEESIGLSAGLVSIRDLDILSRLPGFSTIRIPATFPVRLRIEPPPTGPLSFSGVSSVELHTHNLSFTPGTRLRLFSATAGGNFEDITELMGTGSYRSRGSRGGFSEFLILDDRRPLATVIGTKLNRLDQLLLTHSDSIAPAVLGELEQQIGAARAAWQAGDRLAAIGHTEAFANTVRSHSGADIPDVWRASGDLVNVAGQLRAAAGTLRLSLSLD